MQHIIEETAQRIQPEAMYFFIEDGMRTSITIFDMKDNSDMVAIVELIFNSLNADVQFTPIMNLEDFKKGLSQARVTAQAAGGTFGEISGASTTL
jgi:hypothetical protein